MYVRGSDKNIEYKRDLNGFFRGIIMDDADFKKLYRCKIFVPEIHTIPYTKVKGKQQYTAPDKIGSLPPDVHKSLLDMLPWAEQASSLFGEQSMSVYSAKLGMQTGGVNYYDESRRTNPPNARLMGTAPAETLANASATGGQIADNNPLNPTGNIYAPAPNAPMARGIHGTPSVGAHVWVFFDRGDINCPVYFAACPSGLETNQVMRDRNVTGFSSAYPNEEGVDTPPQSKPPTGAPSTPGETFDGSQYQPTVYGTAFEGGTPENPFGNGRTLDLTTKLETGRTDKDAIDREKYGLRQIPVDWQFIGTRNNTLIPGYHIAVDRVDGTKWPRGTILNINGSNYEVADRAGNHIRNKYGRGPIDFYAGNDRELYDKFRNIKIDSIEVVRVGPGTS